MDQKPAPSLVRSQIEFYVSEISKRDHKITELQDSLLRLKTLLSDKQSQLQSLQQKQDLSQSTGPTRRSSRPANTLEQKEQTIIGLMSQINREKQAKTALKLKYQAIQYQNQQIIKDKSNRIQQLQSQLALMHKKVRQLECRGEKSSRSSMDVSSLTQPKPCLLQNHQVQQYKRTKQTQKPFKPIALQDISYHVINTKKRLQTTAEEYQRGNIGKARKMSLNDNAVQQQKRVKTQSYGEHGKCGRLKQQSVKKSVSVSQQLRDQSGSKPKSNNRDSSSRIRLK